jgi:hypothetical protein
MTGGREKGNGLSGSLPTPGGAAEVEKFPVFCYHFTYLKGETVPSMVVGIP